MTALIIFFSISVRSVIFLTIFFFNQSYGKNFKCDFFSIVSKIDESSTENRPRPVKIKNNYSFFFLTQHIKRARTLKSFKTFHMCIILICFYNYIIRSNNFGRYPFSRNFHTHTHFSGFFFSFFKLFFFKL